MQLEKIEFYKYYIDKYIEYVDEADDEYFDIVMKYDSLNYLRDNAFDDAKKIVYKYIENTINELNELGIAISKNKFFRKYYSSKYFCFEDDFKKISEYMNPVYEFENDVLNYIDSNNSSGMRFAPKNLASIPTALALNAASIVIGGVAKTMMNKSENQNLLDKVKYEKERVFNEIIQSEFLERSLRNSVYNISKAFFDCIEDYINETLYRTDNTDEIKRLLNSEEGINMVLVDEYRKKIKVLSENRPSVDTNKLLDSLFGDLSTTERAILFTLMGGLFLSLFIMMIV